MSDKPQENQDDILEQIISDGLNKVGGPTEDAPQEESPAPEQKPKPAAGKNNKRSAVYLYLLILFGAAFMMLLLAYFVQQRNSEITISDLRDTMNLSRTELMEQINELEKEKEDLQNVLNSFDPELEDQLREQINELEEQADDLTRSANLYWYRTTQMTALSWLEQFCAEKDWLMAAVVVQENDFCLNEHNVLYENVLNGLEPSVLQANRYLELREQVLDNAGCMVLERNTSDPDGEDYTKNPYISPSDSLYDEKDIQTAISLWYLIDDYSKMMYTQAAQRLPNLYNDKEIWQRLEDGLVAPSTMDTIQDIMDTLIAHCYLNLSEEDDTIMFTESATTIPSTATPDDDENIGDIRPSIPE